MSVFDERPGSTRGRFPGNPAPFDIKLELGRSESGPRTGSGRKVAPEAGNPRQ